MASSRMIALLGLLAVAGYQNRDRLAEMFQKATGANRTGDDDRSIDGRPTTGDRPADGLGGWLGGLFGGGQGGTRLAGGLRDLVDRFAGNGHAAEAKSWVETGPNREMTSAQLQEALGDDAIGELSERTGLSRDQILDRLKSVLPTAVDRMTPEGRLPTEAEAARLL